MSPSSRARLETRHLHSSLSSQQGLLQMLFRQHSLSLLQLLPLLLQLLLELLPYQTSRAAQHLSPRQQQLGTTLLST